MPRKQKCYYCDRPAEYLCDFVLEWGSYSKVIADARREGRELPLDEFARAVLNPDEILLRTCDKPLCAQHRVNRGHVFYCGKEGGIDTRDYCPPHAQIPGGSKPRYQPIRGKRCA